MNNSRADGKENQNEKGAKDMSKAIQDVSIDLKRSITQSFDDIEKIETGKLPKRSYKYMIDRVKKRLDEEEK